MRRGLIARSRTELPDAVFEARLGRLRAAMRGLDALLVYTNNTRPAAVSWLTGFIPYWSEALLAVPRDALPVLVVALTFRVKPWIERTSRVADVIHAPRVGIEAARRIPRHRTHAAARHERGGGGGGGVFPAVAGVFGCRRRRGGRGVSAAGRVVSVPGGAPPRRSCGDHAGRPCRRGRWQRFVADRAAR